MTLFLLELRSHIAVPLLFIFMPDNAFLPELSTFIDHILQKMSLNPTQNSEPQASIQVSIFSATGKCLFSPQIGQSLEPANLLLHLVTQANIYKLQNTFDNLMEKDTNATSLLSELKTQFVDKWSLTEDHKVVNSFSVL